MNKVPVLATIRAAYAFTVAQMGAIIGAIWLPMVVVSVAGFFAIHNFFAAMIDMLSGSNPATLGPALVVMFAYLFASLFLYAMMYGAVVQLALGTRAGGTLGYFAFGKAEWRMFRALIALTGLFFAMMVSAMLLLALAVFAAGAAGAHAGIGQNSVTLSLVVYVVLGVGVARFFLLLPAIAVAEDGPVLRRAWELSVGDFLPLLAVAIAVFGPGLFILQLAGMLLTSAGSMPVTGDEQALTLAALQRERTELPLLSGIAFFVSPLTLGLVCGASAAIWRAKTGAAPAAQALNGN